MRMTVKKIDTKNTSIVSMIHSILSLTSENDSVTCTSVVRYFTCETHYDTCTAVISTILKVLTEMGYFTMEYGNVEEYNNTVKVYTRTDKLNDIF